MPSETLTAPIMLMLADHPLGVTAKEMALHLGWKNTKASSLMGRLFFAGTLQRRGALSSPARQNNEYIYTASPAPAMSSTPAPASSWVPSPRIDATDRLPKWAREIATIADRLAEDEVV